MSDRVVKDVFELTYSDVQNDLLNDKWEMAILPWGAIEPHGEHLSYMTDYLLADKISDIVTYVMSFDDKERCLKLPPIYMGQQNIGQVNKKFCINFTVNTIYNVLNDIVLSLSSQGIKHLLIINGHNGNQFKSMIRDLSVKYPDFNIYLCNYLSIIEENKGCDEFKDIPFPEVDDHAAFTETCLMLTHFCEYMRMGDNLVLGDLNEVKKPYLKLNSMWTPRNWDFSSVNTRVGSVEGASPVYGHIMTQVVVEKITEDIVNIFRNKKG